MGRKNKLPGKAAGQRLVWSVELMAREGCCGAN